MLTKRTNVIRGNDTFKIRVYFKLLINLVPMLFFIASKSFPGSNVQAVRQCWKFYSFHVFRLLASFFARCLFTDSKMKKEKKEEEEIFSLGI